MKTNELRIGNLIKLKDSGDIVKVAAITKHKVGFHAPNAQPKTQLRYRRLYEVEGVLICDHWNKIDCPELEGNDNFEDGKWYSFRLCFPPYVRYVHQLQNLYYAMTGGEELKIELSISYKKVNVLTC